MVSELEKILRQSRKDKKLSQDEVAEMAGLTRSEIVKLESGLFVFLENDRLCKIAAAVGINPEMFIAMYRSEFRSELRHLQASQTEKRVNENDTGEHIKEGKDSDSLIPELIKLGEEIRTMPEELQKSLMHTIQLLVQAQAYRLHSKVV